MIWNRGSSRYARRTAIIGTMKPIWCGVLAVAVFAGALAAQDFSGGPALDDVIQQAIQQGRMPGAVLVVGNQGKVVYRKAYGNRSLVPQVEAMTADTIFDCASLTKVIATTSSLMKLFEQGRFRLRSEEHTSELQSLRHLVCRLLLEKKKP